LEKAKRGSARMCGFSKNTHQKTDKKNPRKKETTPPKEPRGGVVLGHDGKKQKRRTKTGAGAQHLRAREDRGLKKKKQNEPTSVLKCQLEMAGDKQKRSPRKTRQS